MVRFVDVYKRSKIYYFIARSAFLGHTMILKGRCRISFGGWIANLVVSLSTCVRNRLVWASQSVIGSHGNYHDMVVTDKTVVWVYSLRPALLVHSITKNSVTLEETQYLRRTISKSPSKFSSSTFVASFLILSFTFFASLAADYQNTVLEWPNETSSMITD